MTPTLSPITPPQAIALPVPGLEDDPEGARIVREELKLLATVAPRARRRGARRRVGGARARARRRAPARAARRRRRSPSPRTCRRSSSRCTTSARCAPSAGAASAARSTATSPYFGHMRLEEQVVATSGDRGRGARSAQGRDAPARRARRRALVRRLGGGHPHRRLAQRARQPHLLPLRRGRRLRGGARRPHRRGRRRRAPRGDHRRAASSCACRRRRARSCAATTGAGSASAASRARLETETQWAARQGVPAEARLGVGADGQVRQDKHLPAIAAMLDEAQFDLIARDSAGLVAIQGSAGSGKTTVGLHRVAYLAFQRAAALPAREDVRRGPERGARPLRGARPAVARRRGGAGDDVRALRRAPRGAGVPAAADEGQRGDAAGRVARQVAPGDAARDRPRRGAHRPGRSTRASSPAMARWPSGDQVVAAWRATESTQGADRRTPPDARVSVLAQWLAGKRQLTGVAGAAPPRRHAQRASSSSSPSLRPRDALGRRRSGTSSSRRARRSARRSPGSRASVRRSSIRCTPGACARRASGARASATAKSRRSTPRTRALLLRCWQALRGPLLDAEAKPIRFAHVFVDEVQDASPVELRVLLELTGQGPQHHARRRRRAAHARRRRRPRRVRLERAPRRTSASRTRGSSRSR